MGKYIYIIRLNEKDSESDFSYYQKKLENGIMMTTPFPEKATRYKSKNDAELICLIKRIENYSIKVLK